MASAIPIPLSVKTLIRPGARFPACRSYLNKLIDVGSASRISFFHLPHSYSLHLALSLCTTLLLPPSPLCFLRRSSLPHFRHSLTVMATPQASSDSTSSTKTERVVIKGRVQGVWYRNWTIDNATQLGLKGWVRNRKDGSVEALFSGTPEAVQEMEQRCRRGPPDAVVTGLEVFPSNDDPGTAFNGKPTV